MNVKKKKSTRKDKDGYALYTGECQRSDGRYSYDYTDNEKKRHYIYATSLLKLREKENKLLEELAYDLDAAEVKKMTLNTLFDRYISQKFNIKDTTKSKYIYDYNKYVRNGFGRRKIKEIKYSDVKKFYYSLIREEGLSCSMVESIHTLLHPAFRLAIRDQLLRLNPTDDVLTEMKKGKSWKKGKRIALTAPQQKALMKYLYETRTHLGWYPVITALVGTGMRISECVGLRWQDIDFDNGMISVNHALIDRPIDGTNRCVKHIDVPKTEAGTRTIPLFDEVREAFIMEYQFQRCLGFCNETVDGYSGFVFCTNTHKTYTQAAINRAIHRIIEEYNIQESKIAAEEDREAVIVPDISAHNLRHTFCTRLCEVETNLKVIQDIMGHADADTTFEIYAEVHPEKRKEVLSNLQGKIIIKE